MGDMLIPSTKLPVEVHLVTVSRWIAAGAFPAPAETICGRRYWRASDIEAWSNGKRSGWKPDADAAKRRKELLERMHGRTRWAEAVA